MSNMSGSHLTKEFFQLVKAIGESKSKQVNYVLECWHILFAYIFHRLRKNIVQEEDRIIALEVKTLKSRMKGGGRKTKVPYVI